LLLPDFTHSFFAEIARAVASTLRPHGYHVVISYFEEDPALEISEVDSMMARQVDGLIAASAQTSRDLGLFARIQNRKIPYVLIDRPIDALPACFVGADNKAIGKLATQHLLDVGCTRIALLRGPMKAEIAAARFEGCLEALAQRGLRARPRYVISGGYGSETGYDGMSRLLHLKPVPDGVVCYNDPVAIGAIHAIREAGLSVPGDIAVVGAGNIQYSDVLTVPLTTLDQRTTETGTRAANLLLERITAKRSLRPKKVLIRPVLVVRESTRRVPKA
jgi:LacI family transcriptional regulator